MLDRAYTQKMASYNRWQNEKHYSTAATLSDDERQQERGTFFGSIQKTLGHLVWADQVWLSRFSGRPKPQGGIPDSVRMFGNWTALHEARVALDHGILAWAESLSPEWIAGDLTWFSGGAQRDMTKPAWLLVVHFFNHQNHHRGQVHCMLTEAGTKPRDTDLMLLPE